MIFCNSELRVCSIALLTHVVSACGTVDHGHCLLPGLLTGGAGQELGHLPGRGLDTWSKMQHLDGYI